MASNILKSSGISKRSEEVWKQQLKEYQKGKRLTTQSKSFIQAIEKYFHEHKDSIPNHQRLLCCSDIIESTFGRYKNKGGMAAISADVLSLALYRQKITIGFIQKAMVKVHQKELDNWEQLYTCDNRYSLLRRMNRELKTVA